MENQKPSIGRIVHFNSPITVDDKPATVAQAALVVAIHGEDCISVVAWNEYGTANAQRSISQGTAAGQWSWPPRV